MTPEQRQEVFDRVCKHLLTQGERSELDGRCTYRGDGGRMCAIGCLIDNAHYQKTLEGSSIWISFVRDAVAKSLNFDLEKSDMFLLSALQGCHDDIPSEEWYGTLEYIAYSYDLEMKYD